MPVPIYLYQCDQCWLEHRTWEQAVLCELADRAEKKDAPMPNTDEQEARLAALTDAELLEEHRKMEVDDPLLDLVLGECERRNLDP